MKNTTTLLSLVILLVSCMTQVKAQHDKLISFTTKNTDGGVRLEWATDRAQTNTFFALERSQDGLHFAAIQQVNSTGSNNELLSYQAIDKAPFLGVTYYRLRQTNSKGESTFSEVVRVDTVYPNVLAREENISAGLPESGQHIQFSLSDKNGQVILQKELITSRLPVEVEIPQLPAGWYLVKEEGSNQAQMQNVSIKLSAK